MDNSKTLLSPETCMLSSSTTILVSYLLNASTISYFIKACSSTSFGSNICLSIDVPKSGRMTRSLKYVLKICTIDSSMCVLSLLITNPPLFPIRNGKLTPFIVLPLFLPKTHHHPTFLHKLACYSRRLFQTLTIHTHPLR